MSCESAIPGRRLRVSAAAAALLAVLLSGCVPAPVLRPAERPASVVDEYDDGLTVTSGSDAAYVELVDGYFADDEDALAVAVATLEEYLDERHSVARDGDPDVGDLNSIPVPPMGLDVRQLLASEMFGSTTDGVRVDVENAFIVRRTEDAHGAIVNFAFCRVDTATEPPLATVRREFAASAVSTAEEPRRLQLTSILTWVGEPFC
ncbi:hypothetical protein GCM10009717_02060 [Agromyces allii]|uniref:Uncharacterized protein n=2 Tax=Agromyces allii TaxID=393607 RepID=A0ABP5BB97_9MICO